MIASVNMVAQYGTMSVFGGGEKNNTDNSKHVGLDKIFHLWEGIKKANLSQIGQDMCSCLSVSPAQIVRGGLTLR